MGFGPLGQPLPQHLRLPNINSADQLIKWVEDHFLKCDWKAVESNRKYQECFTTVVKQLGYVPVPTQPSGKGADTSAKAEAISRTYGEGSPWDEKSASVTYIH